MFSRWVRLWSHQRSVGLKGSFRVFTDKVLQNVQIQISSVKTIEQIAVFILNYIFHTDQFVLPSLPMFRRRFVGMEETSANKVSGCSLKHFAPSWSVKKPVRCRNVQSNSRKRNKRKELFPISQSVFIQRNIFTEPKAGCWFESLCTLLLRLFSAPPPAPLQWLICGGMRLEDMQSSLDHAILHATSDPDKSTPRKRRKPCDRGCGGGCSRSEFWRVWSLAVGSGPTAPWPLTRSTLVLPLQRGSSTVWGLNPDSSSAFSCVHVGGV